MARLIQSLRDDHAEMHQLLRSLAGDTAVLTDNNRDPDYYRFAEVVRCFIHLPDVYHHAAENKLFDFLLEQEPRYRGAITRLKYEHLELSTSANHLYLLLDGVCTGHIVSRLDLLHDTHNFISDQIAHMAFEEEQVFVLCSRFFDTRAWVRLERNLQKQFNTDAVLKVKSEFQWLFTGLESNAQTADYTLLAAL
ncbi:MAG: hemerythrin-like domain-containing protein [Gammaproteobacteria bacterium]|jgi:hemerythrin-like domain-containing protein